MFLHISGEGYFTGLKPQVCHDKNREETQAEATLHAEIYGPRPVCAQTRAHTGGWSALCLMCEAH